MTKESTDIETLLSQLESYKTTILDSSSRLITAFDRVLYINDLIFCAVTNRAVSLIDGFITLAKKDNYLCAIPLIRLQLDNSLRYYAHYFVEDSEDFFSHFLSGKPIKEYRSKENIKLSDSYLISQLERKIPGVKKIYKETSNYIHLSDQHLWVVKHRFNKKDKTAIVNGSCAYFRNSEKILLINTMMKVSSIVNTFIEDWHNIKLHKYTEKAIIQH